MILWTVAALDASDLEAVGILHVRSATAKACHGMDNKYCDIILGRFCVIYGG